MEAEKKKPVVSIDLLVTIVVAAGCVYMLFASQSFRSLLSRLFPQVIAGVTLLACIAQAIISVRKSKKGAAAKQDGVPAPNNHLMVAGISVVYLVCMYFIGFVISTIALTIVIPFLLGNKNKATVVIVGVALTLTFYIVFKRFFYVPLPAGILPF